MPTAVIGLHGKCLFNWRISLPLSFSLFLSLSLFLSFFLLLWVYRCCFYLANVQYVQWWFIDFYDSIHRAQFFHLDFKNVSISFHLIKSWSFFGKKYYVSTLTSLSFLFSENMINYLLLLIWDQWNQYSVSIYWFLPIHECLFCNFHAFFHLMNAILRFSYWCIYDELGYPID